MRGVYWTVMFECVPSQKILRCEGITHDHFMRQIAFILVLLDGQHVFDCCVCQHYIALHCVALHYIHNTQGEYPVCPNSLRKPTQLQLAS